VSNFSAKTIFESQFSLSNGYQIISQFFYKFQIEILLKKTLHSSMNREPQYFQKTIHTTKRKLLLFYDKFMNQLIALIFHTINDRLLNWKIIINLHRVEKFTSLWHTLHNTMFFRIIIIIKSLICLMLRRTSRLIYRLFTFSTLLSIPRSLSVSLSWWIMRLFGRTFSSPH
jgi:hypothetical protein